MLDYSCNGPRITVHRQPTKNEIRFGHGAIHHKDMPVSLFESFIVAGKTKHATIEEAKEHAQSIFQKCGAIVSIERHVKKWTVCPIDGLRYYR